MLRTVRASLVALKLALASGVFVTTMVAAPASVHAAESAEADIAAAEAAFGQLGYEDAIKKAESAIKLGNLTHDQLRRVYKVLAYAREREGSEAADSADLTETPVETGDSTTAEIPF